MHDTAFKTGRLFFDTYFQPSFSKVLDVGSMDVNGSLRCFASKSMEYVGVDLAPGRGVDIVLDDPHQLPFEPESFDMIVSTSCFEHDSMFWLTFLECCRVLKPTGFLYVSAPSNGEYHAYPLDNWRFYPDSGIALVDWAVKNGITIRLIESFVMLREGDQWNDTVMVFGGASCAPPPESQLISSRIQPLTTNVRTCYNKQLSRQQKYSQDQLISQALKSQLQQRLPAERSKGHLAPAPVMSKFKCYVCGSTSAVANPVLWPELIQQWELSPNQVDYINLQQGLRCTSCNSNLRSSVLAKAIIGALGSSGTLQAACSSPTSLRILEVNLAGDLDPWLQKLGHVTLATYPTQDLTALSYPDQSFDVVIHSDTLEHVIDPARALAECYRVLVPGGKLCFTVPVVVETLTRSRSGMPASYHGVSATVADDWLVHTEFGSDVWRWAAEAGFDNVTMSSVMYPAGLAVSAVKTV